jgi:CheY-like chemotaxis protein
VTPVLPSQATWQIVTATECHQLSAPINNSPLDPKAALERAQESFSRTGNKHCLVVKTPEHLPLVLGDGNRIDQVLVNLVHNAAKFSPASASITVQVEPGPTEVTMHVQDQGIGIPPDKLPLLFQKFTRLHADGPTQTQGIGLGLAICKGIIEAHRGRIWAESPGLGKGSTFSFTLPVVSTAASEVSPARQPAKSSADMVVPTANSLRVLFVDDNADSRRITRVLLEAYAYQVRTAHDGPSALEAALEFRSDVVILDVGLPGMSGYEVAQQMRQEPTLENVVLVAVTGYGLESARQRSQEAGFDHHLLKGAERNELLSLLEIIAEEKARGGR